MEKIGKKDTISSIFESLKKAMTFEVQDLAFDTDSEEYLAVLQAVEKTYGILTSKISGLLMQNAPLPVIYKLFEYVNNNSRKIADNMANRLDAQFAKDGKECFGQIKATINQLSPNCADKNSKACCEFADNLANDKANNQAQSNKESIQDYTQAMTNLMGGEAAA